jgi:large subunit ribosomal protein L3
MTGHFAKAGVEPGVGCWEFRIEELGDWAVGAEVPLDTFAEGQYVDVTGTSKGKGFAGVIKRHHFGMQDATHGNSLSHRAHGSTGQNQTPGRVFKGKKMAGHLGNVQRTVQSQKIVSIDTERRLILVNGVVPGAPNGIVIIRPAVKKVAQGE